MRICKECGQTIPHNDYFYYMAMEETTSLPQMLGEIPENAELISVAYKPEAKSWVFFLKKTKK